MGLKAALSGAVLHMCSESASSAEFNPINKLTLSDSEHHVEL